MKRQCHQLARNMEEFLGNGKQMSWERHKTRKEGVAVPGSRAGGGQPKAAGTGGASGDHCHLRLKGLWGKGELR